MDPTIVAGIIGAGGSIIASGIAIVFNGKKKSAEKHVSRLEAALEKQAQSLGQSASYTIDKMIKRISFDDHDNCEQRQEWLGIKANQSYQNLKIPFKFIVHGNDSDLSDPIAGEMSGSALPVQAIFDPIDKSKGNVRTLIGKFNILGYCDQDTGPISFFWEQKFRKGFVLTREEAKEAFSNSEWKTEYTASTVIAPTKHLKLQVKFPDSHESGLIKASAIAFVGGTNVVNKMESARISDAFEISNRKATLSIANPIIGMSYAIAWMPPPKKIG